MTAGGLYATFGYSPEVTWSTYVAPNHFVTMLKEEGEYKKTTIQATTLDGQLYDQSTRRGVTKIGASQAIDLDLFDRGLGLLFKNAFGASSVSNAGSVYTYVFTPADTTGLSMSIQVGRPNSAGTVTPISYEGVKVTEWSIGAKAGELATFNATFDAYQEDSTQTYTAASYTSSNVLTAVEASLLIGGTPSTTSGVTSVSGGTAVPLVKDVMLKFTNPLDDNRYFIGSAYKSEQLVNKKRQVKGTATIQFANLTQVYNAFKADTSTALQFNVTGPIISGSTTSALNIIIPVIFWDTDKFPAQSTELIDQSVSFTGLYDGTDNAVQATMVTLDSTL
jgi:hypothetical protein